jgi:hypothetical protein
MSSCGVPDLRCGAEVGELGRGVAEGFLGSVSEGCEEVFEKDSLFVHVSSFTRSLFYVDIWGESTSGTG